ncbi:MAG TPA: hypothetical protein VE690_07180 [Rhodopila sp.]|nr:hypothetical protein [Rhodopila sp.]
MGNPILDVLGNAVPLLEKVAPTIALAVGGPLAGTAVTYLGRALGLDVGSDPEKVAAVMAAPTPEQLEAMQKADHDFALAMGQLNLSLEKQNDEDRTSARAREMTVKDRTPRILAYALTAGLFGFIALLLLVPHIPDNSMQALNLALGSIATAWVAVISYYFGSSSGSQAKDLLLYHSVPTGQGR